MRRLLPSFTWLLLPFIFLATASHHEQLRILPSSTLTISGSSNITDFSCCCEDFAPIRYEIEVLNATQLRLSETLLRIPVQTLDCGNRLMNKDLRQTLRVEEHPYINIRPLSLQLQKTPPVPMGQWISLTAKAEVSLAGTTQQVELEVTARRLTEQRWQIRTQKELCFFDFGIEPPTAMGGLIKVKDEITIHFDLFVENY